MSKQREDGQWLPELEWGFAKYRVLPSLDVRAGRLRMPLFMMADTVDVNYANPWVRPPVEMYGANPISNLNLNGVDVLWRPRTGAVTWLVQPFYGSNGFNIRSASVNGVASSDLTDVFGMHVSASWRDFTLRGAFMQTDLGLKETRLQAEIIPALKALCQVRQDAAACGYAQLLQRSTPASIGSLGGNWDNGDYFVTGEYAMRNSHTLAPADSSSWYVTTGTRLQQWTPYVSYARMVNNDPTQFSGGTGRLPGFFTNGVITQMMQLNPMDQATVSLGLRYDVLSNLALKFQWDRVDTLTKEAVAGTGRGVFLYKTRAFQSNDNTVDLFSLSMDFAF